MRTQNEIKQRLNDDIKDFPKLEKEILSAVAIELLIDIRELLLKKEESTNTPQIPPLGQAIC